MEPSPCFSNFLARTTFVLESLREAKNPGQDAFFGDLRTFLSNFVATGIYALLLKFWFFWDLRTFLSIFWGFTHFLVEFCRDRRLRTFVKILSWRLSSNPILGLVQSYPGPKSEYHPCMGPPCELLFLRFQPWWLQLEEMRMFPWWTSEMSPEAFLVNHHNNCEDTKF